MCFSRVFNTALWAVNCEMYFFEAVLSYWHNIRRSIFQAFGLPGNNEQGYG
jgi:hypothetical protein